jgi:cell division inhibitor SepF
MGRCLAENRRQPVPSRGVADPLPGFYRVTRFNDVQAFGDAFRSGERVEFSVEGADPEVARRVVDFATGMVYADGGSMERVGDDRYVMAPRSRPSRLPDR